MSIRGLVIVSIVSVFIALICGLLGIDRLYMCIINGVCMGILFGLDIV